MAERIEIKDRNGSVFKEVLKYEGILWPKVVHDPVQRVRDTWDFPYMDGDMFVCSYPKTGKIVCFVSKYPFRFGVHNRSRWIKGCKRNKTMK